MSDITTSNINDLTTRTLQATGSSGTPTATTIGNGVNWFENARLLVDLNPSLTTQFTNTTDIPAGSEGAGRTFYAHGANLVLYDLIQATANTDIELVDCSVTLVEGQSSLGTSASPLAQGVAGVQWTLTDTFFFATKAGETGFGAVVTAGNEPTLIADGLVLEAHEGAVWFVNMAGLHQNSSLNNVTFIRSVINTPSAAFPFVGFNLDGTVRSTGNPYIIRLTGSPSASWSGMFGSTITGEYTLPDGTDASTTGVAYQDFWGTTARNFYSVNNVYARSITKTSRASDASATILEGYTWRPEFTDAEDNSGVTDIKLGGFLSTARLWYNDGAALSLTTEPALVALSGGDYYLPSDGEQSFFMQTGSLAASATRNELDNANHAFEFYDSNDPDARTLRSPITYNYFSYTHNSGSITTQLNDFDYSGGIAGTVTYNSTHSISRTADNLIGGALGSTSALGSATGVVMSTENSDATTMQSEYRQYKEYNYRRKVTVNDVPATYVGTELTYSRPYNHGSAITFAATGAITSDIGTTFNGNDAVNTISTTTNAISLASGVTYGGTAETNFETTSGAITANGTLSTNCTLTSASGTINVSSATLSGCTLDGTIQGIGTTVGTSAGTATIQGGSTIDLQTLTGTHNFAITWGNLTVGGTGDVTIIADSAVTIENVPNGFVAGTNVTIPLSITFPAPPNINSRVYVYAISDLEGPGNVATAGATPILGGGTDNINGIISTDGEAARSTTLPSGGEDYVIVFTGYNSTSERLYVPQVYKTGNVTTATTISAPPATDDVNAPFGTGQPTYRSSTSAIQDVDDIQGSTGEFHIRINGTAAGDDPNASGDRPTGIQTAVLLTDIVVGASNADREAFARAIAYRSLSISEGSWASQASPIFTFNATNAVQISDAVRFESDGTSQEQLQGLTGTLNATDITAGSVTVPSVIFYANPTPDEVLIAEEVFERVDPRLEEVITAAENAESAVEDLDAEALFLQ